MPRINWFVAEIAGRPGALVSITTLGKLHTEEHRVMVRFPGMPLARVVRTFKMEPGWGPTRRKKLRGEAQRISEQLAMLGLCGFCRWNGIVASFKHKAMPTSKAEFDRLENHFNPRPKPKRRNVTKIRERYIGG